MVAYSYERDVRKQRFRVRYWVVIYMVPFLFDIAEKNLLIDKLRDWSKRERGGGSSVFEPLVRGGSCKFSYP